MPHSDERKTAVVIVENRDKRSYVSDNEPKQTVSMEVPILFMFCSYAQSFFFIYKEHIEIRVT